MLQSLGLTQNHYLSGSLPSGIGTWLPDLEGFYIGSNEFSGKLPLSISNMSKLTVLVWTRIFHVRPHSIGETRFYL